MTSSKTWKYLHEGIHGSDENAILDVILKNRNLRDKKEVEHFLHPNLSDVTVESVGINEKNLVKALMRLEKAKEEKEGVIIFGDYDVDGVTGTAILWETLHGIGFVASPFIPDRLDEGYGLSIKGIDNVLKEKPDTKLIITVDNGIVAHEAVGYAKEKGIDVIITDHHLPNENLPPSYTIVHSTHLCGAAVAWIFSQKLLEKYPGDYFFQKKGYEHLSLVALATVADLVPLKESNRILLKFGLVTLQKTKRPGLQALFHIAKIIPESIGVYAIGHMIAPRLNAMGRLESAMDSLRLLCTKNPQRGKMLAEKLDHTNRERQLLTQRAGIGAQNFVLGMTEKKKLLFVASEEYEEGIIGLVAGKLVEMFYLPSIVLSQGKDVSKGSARSILGFNIIQFIREAEHLLINAGGHPMAAGFTVRSEKLGELQDFLEKRAEEIVLDEMRVRYLSIDCRLPLSAVTQKLFDTLSQLEPFGHSNGEPVFASTVIVKQMSAIGSEKQHLKLKVTQDGLPYALDAIAFGMGEVLREIESGEKIDIAYTVDENDWNGRKNLQLKIKDIRYKKTEVVDSY